MNRTKESGFTLLEIIVTLMITGVLASSALANWSTADGIGLRGRSLQLAADLRLAQSLSMSRGTPYSVTEWSGGYAVLDATTGNMVSQTKMPGILIAGALPISFNGLGVPSQGGTITLHLNETMVAVQVEAETGFVRTP